MGLIKTLLAKANGWKTILGYVLVNIPFFSENPLIVEAINKIVSNPRDMSAWLNLIVNALLAIGVIHRTVKNVAGK